MMILLFQAWSIWIWPACSTCVRVYARAFVWHINSADCEPDMLIICYVSAFIRAIDLPICCFSVLKCGVFDMSLHQHVISIILALHLFFLRCSSHVFSLSLCVCVKCVYVNWKCVCVWIHRDADFPLTVSMWLPCYQMSNLYNWLFTHKGTMSKFATLSWT